MRSWRLEGLEVEQGPFRLGPVDLEVADGSAVAVLGPSGAGKTTLLRAIAGLLIADRGRLRVDGTEITTVAPERRRAVFVPQGLALFPHRTVGGNVAYARSLAEGRRAEVVSLLDRFGLGPLAGRLPGQLSSGEQQRVAIARALAARPELLLWDEPLTALDRAAREDLLAALHEVRDRERLPMLFVTHDPALAFSIADRALVLARGRVEFVGTIEELLARPTSAFVARFAGYENVLETETIGTGPSSSWNALLRRLAGPRGLCFRAPEALLGEATRGTWTATVRRVEPRLGGWEYLAEVEGRSVRLRSVAAPRVRAGDRVGFDLDERDVVPIPGTIAEAR